MPEQVTTDAGNKQVRRRWDRMTSATLVEAYEEAQWRGTSQREFAEANGVPRTTLRFWLERKATLDADPVLVRFFESPTGLAFLHRLLCAVHFLFCQVGLCGVDQVCRFLELTGLDAFVGASHGEQDGVASTMTDQIVAFGATQGARLAATMPPRTIALAEDETFPEGAVWLVAMDPVSGFIVLEEVADNREAATWTEAVQTATADMPVAIAVAAGDEAVGLLAHAGQIGAHHAPDLFHVQHPLWQALARPLVRSLDAPLTALKAAEAITAAWRGRMAQHEQGVRAVGRPPDFARHLAAAQAVEDQARLVYESAVGLKDAAYAAIRQLGQAYHPVDPATGDLRDAATVARDLDAAMTTIDAAATAVDLPDKRRRLIDKARRVMPKMVATIAFFHAELARQLTALGLPTTIHDYVTHVLVPAAYLSRLAERATTVAQRHALLTVREAVLARGDPTCLLVLPEDTRQQLDRLVLTCVDLFVRSSSCVEGRNGRLSLWHHHLHRLSAARMTALTVLHNFWSRRADGTTAAQRFFEAPHDDLFEWLLDRMDLPSRPRTAAAQAEAA